MVTVTISEGCSDCHYLPSELERAWHEFTQGRARACRRASIRAHWCVFYGIERGLICIGILTVCISIQSQYRVNTDQSIHDVFASIRAYWCVFVSIEWGLICIGILTVCISIQLQYRVNTDQSIRDSAMYSLVFVRIYVCLSVLNGAWFVSGYWL